MLGGTTRFRCCTDNMFSCISPLFPQPLCSFVTVSGVLHLCTQVYLLRCRFIWFYGSMLCSPQIDAPILSLLAADDPVVGVRVSRGIIPLHAQGVLIRRDATWPLPALSLYPLHESRPTFHKLDSPCSNLRRAIRFRLPHLHCGDPCGVRGVPHAPAAAASETRYVVIPPRGPSG